ncbi:MAG: hypothetical protein WBF29_10245, partial [Syntrophobacteria bacterium]
MPSARGERKKLVNAGKDCELSWITGGLEIQNHKSQINNNDRDCPRFAWTPHPAGGSPVSKFQTCFGHLVLEFDIFQCST